MKAISTLFVALTLLKVSSSQFECDSNNLCFCIQNIDNYEYLCPINYAEEGGFAVTITKDKEIIIDCHNLTSFDVNRLPEVTLHEVNLLYLKFCPFPETGFVPILKWFSIDEIEHLEVEHGIHGNGTLDKRTFAGFRTLRHLKLNRNGLKDLKANVFEPLIHLISLELQENTVQLKKNFFNNTPFLELLDISSNNLQSLPEGLFGALEQLESLQLWDNNITELHNYTLRGLVALKVLDLSSNNIQVVSEDAFEELKVLSRLNLGHNNLHGIPPNLFKPVRIIESIKMNDNPKLQLPDYLFSNLTHLHDVDLSNCKLTEIPEHIFENSSGLRVVELQMNNLNHFRSHLFKGLIDLEELYLDDNLIESVENKFASLRGLKILSLRKNLIRTIEIDAFADLIRLEEINLESNEISRIHPYTFHSDTLKKINLSKNLYAGKNKYDPSALLANTVNIEEVDLSYNLIAQVDDVIDLYNKVLLKNLDLSHNRLTNITLTELQAPSDLYINLDYNNVTTVSFQDVGSILGASTTTISLQNNPVHCDCNNYDLLKYFRDEMAPEVKQLFDVRAEGVVCGVPVALKGASMAALPLSSLNCSLDMLLGESTGCPEECSCVWQPFDSSVVVDCSNKNLTELPDIMTTWWTSLDFSQIELRLQNNSLGPEIDFTGYDNVTRLFLSNNKLKMIYWLPPKLQIVALDNNQLSHLRYEVLQLLNNSNLASLTLHNNSWICDCETDNLTSFIRQHTKQVDFRDLYCVNSTNRLIDLTRSDLCRKSSIIIPIVSVLSFISMLLASSIALYYRYQQEVKIWLYAKHWCLWWISEEELDNDKIYDAFLSYSHKDEDFVVRNLLPVLENGPEAYKLCLHQRDWIPGEFIVSQITTSVQQSRRTVVVLSQNFIESVWAKMEFKTAASAGRVVVILYGDLDFNNLDPVLKVYLKTKTYVKWGDPHFWKKLKYALPHSTA